MLTPLLFSCGESDEYTIVFMADGKEYQKQTLSTDKLPSVVKNPTLSGFAFDGWYYDNGVWEHPFKLSEFSPESDTQDGEVRIYAKFVPTYTVSFVAVNNVCKTETLTYDKNPTAPTAPTLTGYRFGGWYFDSGVWSVPYTDGGFVPTTDAAGGTATVYARYVPIYTVYFCIGSVVYEKAEYDYNVKPTLPDNPTEDGLAFAGWYYDDNIWERQYSEDSFNPETLNAGAEIRLYARFTESTGGGTLGGDADGNFDPEGWTKP